MALVASDKFDHYVKFWAGKLCLRDKLFHNEDIETTFLERDAFKLCETSFRFSFWFEFRRPILYDSRRLN